MMTPINRIPLEGMTEMQLINSEPTADYTAEYALTELLDHTDSENHISITMDWAMQLRDRTGMDWGTCIRIAMTAYFG